MAGAICPSTSPGPTTPTRCGRRPVVTSPGHPSEYLHKLYFDTTVFSTSAVEYLVGEFGADHVLMGTDYPFDMGPTDPLGFLADANLTEEEHALVVGGNAARLLRIPAR